MLRANGRNIVGQNLPPLLDVTCCVRLQTCCMLLPVFFWQNKAMFLLNIEGCFATRDVCASAKRP